MILIFYAAIVDVIHTDGDYKPCGKKIRGLGLLEPVGHFDFYPSDGGQQGAGRLPAAVPVQPLLHPGSILFTIRKDCKFQIIC